MSTLSRAAHRAAIAAHRAAEGPHFARQELDGGRRLAHHGGHRGLLALGGLGGTRGLRRARSHGRELARGAVEGLLDTSHARGKLPRRARPGLVALGLKVIQHGAEALVDGRAEVRQALQGGELDEAHPLARGLGRELDDASWLLPPFSAGEEEKDDAAEREGSGRNSECGQRFARLRGANISEQLLLTRQRHLCARRVVDQALLGAGGGTAQ